MVLVVSAVALVVVVVTSLEVLIGARQLVRLASIPEGSGPLETTKPMVSVVIAARNEEKHIESALQSVINLQYQPLEIIVVNDRSFDRTGPILNQIKLRHPHVDVVTISELPSGWLGKNHAHYLGSQRARGELILFTDADIVFDPSALSRAVTYYRRAQLDHLTLLPALTPPRASHGIRAFYVFFTLSFFLFTKCWRARKPGVSGAIGIGAFNLISRRAYEAIGTHRAIALRPDDDLKMGLLVKRHGFKQDIVLGDPIVSVEFYTSIREAVHGFHKNSFGSLEYSLPRVIAATAALALLNFWPIAQLFLSSGLTRGINLAIILTTLFTAADLSRITGQKPAYALTYPFGALVLIFITLRSATLTLWDGGMHWRDTFYPLAELKKNRF